QVLRKESDVRLRYYMFKRLNSGGESLEPQEIRNCTIRLLSPIFNDVLLELADDDNFKYCISTVADAQKGKRYDQELVLRFFAFLRTPGSYRHEVGDFLTEYMEAASEPTGPPPEIFDAERDKAIFKRTFSILRRAAESDEATIGRKVFGAVDTKRQIEGQ